jgi:hypothetical protein
METRRYYTWWFKIETYHGNVTILFLQHRTLHFMCKDLTSGAAINIPDSGVM